MTSQTAVNTEAGYEGLLDNSERVGLLAASAGWAVSAPALAQSFGQAFAGTVDFAALAVLMVLFATSVGYLVVATQRLAESTDSVVSPVRTAAVALAGPVAWLVWARRNS